jgi:hypothetical protein
MCEESQLLHQQDIVWDYIIESEGIFSKQEIAEKKKLE